MLPRTLRWYLIAFLAMAQTAAAQTTLKGGVSAGSQPTLTEIYSGQDPLKGKPETMPPQSTGDCVPPKGWILIYRTKTTCYYFAPFAVPLQGKAMTPDEAGKYTWPRCSAHPWDPSLIICYGTPVPKQGYTGAMPLSGGTSAGRFLDPCHPYFDMSTAEGRSRAAQLAEQGKNACDEERCKHNPELQVCKGVTRDQPPVDQPGQKATGPPSLRAVWQTMNRCLRDKLPYMVVTLPQAPYVHEARSAADPPVPLSTPFDQLSFQSQVFIQEMAAGLQAQAYHDSIYGQAKYDPGDPRDTNNPAIGKYYLVGWLDHCLQSAGLEPQGDPRVPYAKFLSVGMTDPRVLEVGSGYGDDLLPPRPLLPKFSR